MTGRIRWERNDDGSTVTATWEGSIGKIDEAVFWIFEPTDREPWWILTSSLPGQGQYRVHNDEAEALKTHAGRWLAEFVSSLGAVFAEPQLPARDEDHHLHLTCGACGQEFGTNCYDDDIRCAVCSAHRCPHCGGWFGED